VSARSIVLVSVLASIVALRWWCLRWGATASEGNVVLPGDALISGEDLTATRALTIQAKAEAVWPWIAQLGQGRGGFYSYDCLENLIGCDIHSADRIVPEWQGIEAGDEVRLARAFGLVVASVERDRSLVLGGGIPLGNAAAPYDFTWAFVLRDQPDGTTRLLVRERYAYRRPWARLLVEPTEAMSFVMTQKMLRGIRDRAERTASAVGSEPRRRCLAARGVGPGVGSRHAGVTRGGPLEADDVAAHGAQTAAASGGP
jgi:hypothetical protein